MMIPFGKIASDATATVRLNTWLSSRKKPVEAAQIVNVEADIKSRLLPLSSLSLFKKAVLPALIRIPLILSNHLPKSEFQ